MKNMMNMTERKINMVNRYFFLMTGIILIPFIAYSIIVYHSKKNEASTYVKAIKVPGGWGYELVYMNKTLIRQDYIPAVPGKHPFQERTEALEVGQLALQRYLQAQRPAISVKDLDSLKIKRPELTDSIR
jgi:hypothetical protein